MLYAVSYTSSIKMTQQHTLHVKGEFKMHFWHFMNARTSISLCICYVHLYIRDDCVFDTDNGGQETL